MGTTVRDLPENATKEQIDELVDKFIVDPSSEDSGSDDPKDTDAGKVDDSSDSPKKTETDSQLLSDDKVERVPVDDETPVNDDDAAAESGEDGDETVEDETDWITDEVRSSARMLGIAEDELDVFSSKEEFDKAYSFLLKNVMSRGREQTESEEKEGEGGKETSSDATLARGPDGRFLPRNRAEENGSSKDATTTTGYQLKLDPEEFEDDEIARELTALNEHYESRLKAFEDRFAVLERAEAEREQAALEAQFDSLVDSLGHADLFGETGKESDAQLENRKKLFASQQYLIAGMAAHGLEPRLDSVLLSRVLHMEFAEQLAKKQRKQHTRKIQRQSNMRMGGGSTKATETPPSIEEEMEQLYKQLEEQDS